MENKKHLFDIPDDIVYLNAANLSPLPNITNEAGKQALDRKSRPYMTKADDFFNPLLELKSRYAKLIDLEEPLRIASIPSASYGIATVANNIKLHAGDEILLVGNEFPSNYYSWKRLTDKYNAVIKTVKKPVLKEHCGRQWNIAILDAITNKTAVVAMGHIHWADGTLFDLKTISKKTKKHNALLIIDGSQSVGALPFSVKDIQPDALICAGYKWLFGPYSSGLAYYGPYFDNGIPIEENWSNRLHSENFAGLTNYEDAYKPFASRYNVGENANFIAVSMLKESIALLLEWTPEGIQKYCHAISKDVIESIRALGCNIEDSEFRSKHLFGIELPKDTNSDILKAEFEKRHVFVAFRGHYIRVSCHLFNTNKDFETLFECLSKVIKTN
ncbi:aminotransferase class V-fold PLP-dependent enzyme [Confluentibacter citreus]|uniref:aminotransferase class V-fold PLP-dependent enzyme n=1 Tax=Confluentibacter citreus TaxID=2007307 RepID=UPI000C28D9BE|nr:aminotransferase class V-fold PLP-dependent enzyme [Confluentibacter citreus]